MNETFLYPKISVDPCMLPASFTSHNTEILFPMSGAFQYPKILTCPDARRVGHKLQYRNITSYEWNFSHPKMVNGSDDAWHRFHKCDTDVLLLMSGTFQYPKIPAGSDNALGIGDDPVRCHSCLVTFPIQAPLPDLTPRCQTRSVSLTGYLILRLE